MYMINYKNTYRRKVTLAQRIAAFFSGIAHSVRQDRT